MVQSLQGGVVFSKVDLSHAVMLWSQDVFQKRMDHIYERCEGTMGIAYDLIVFGKDEEEHDKNLRKVMEVTQENGGKLNFDKCQVKLPRIKFYGLICERGGVRPDTEKVMAIRDMPPPESDSELHTFIGLATYLGPFIPKLSEKTGHLRQLLHKEPPFEWLPCHREAFDNVKDMISEDTKLAYLDTQKPVILQVDASQHGLGAALIQQGKPIAFASKALTKTESNLQTSNVKCLQSSTDAKDFIHTCTDELSLS